MDQEQDETIVVSRTTPLTSEETVITTSTNNVDEATVTNPTFSGSDLTSTGPQGFGVSEESDPVGPIPTYEVLDADVAAEEVETTIEREVGQVFEAPAVVPTKAMPLPVVAKETKYDIQPEAVVKSKPSTDASKLLKKNINRSKRNSMGVILAVVVGALLIGVTLAILFATLT
jgi:hypothetical protein